MAQASSIDEKAKPELPLEVVGGRSKKPEPRIHHYLAQRVLLKHFQRPDKPGQVYLYERRAKKVVSVGFKNVGCERDLYTFTGEQGEADYRIETELMGKLDSELAPIIDRLNGSLSSFLLKPKLPLIQPDVALLAAFTAFQMQRTTAAIQEMEDMSHAMIKCIMQKITAMDGDRFPQKMRELLKEEPDFQGVEVSDAQIEIARQAFLRGNYELKKTRDPYYMGMALDIAQDLVPLLLMKGLEIWKAPPGKFFLTSDWPVIKITDPDAPPLYRGGFISSHIIFPIGSTTAIFWRTLENPAPPKRLNRLSEAPIREMQPYAVDKINAKMVTGAEFTVLGSFYDDRIQKALVARPKPTRFRVG